MSEMVHVLCVEPGAVPKEAVLQNDLRSLQNAVGGLIELVPVDEGVCILCNEEGKLTGLEGNRRLGDDILVGTFYVLGCDDRGELTSLTSEQMRTYTQRFKEPETFTRQEIEDTTGFTFVAL